MAEKTPKRGKTVDSGRVEKSKKKEKKDKATTTTSSKKEKSQQLAAAEKAFTLLADEGTVDPALKDLFAVRVCLTTRECSGM